MNWTERKEIVEGMLDRVLEHQKTIIDGPVDKDDAIIVGYLVETADRASSEARYAKDTDEFFDLRTRLSRMAEDVPEIVVLPADYKQIPQLQKLLEMGAAIKDLAASFDHLDL